MLGQVQYSLTSAYIFGITNFFRGFSFTITLRQKPKEVPHRKRWIIRQRESMRCLRRTPLGFCLRVIVNEKPLKIKRRHLLSYLLLLINLCIRTHVHIQYIHVYVLYVTKTLWKKKIYFWIYISPTHISSCIQVLHSTSSVHILCKI